MTKFKMTRRTFGGAGLAMLATAAAPAAAQPKHGGPTIPTGARPSLAREVADLRHFAEATHPNGPLAAKDAKWRGLADRLQAEANRLTPERYMIGVLRLLSWFEDGHTTVMPFANARGSFGLRFPLQAEAFSDGVYVLDASEEAAPFRGARITRVGGASVQAVLRMAEDFWPRDNLAWLQRWSPFLLTNPGFLRGMGLIKGPTDAPVTFEGVSFDGRNVRADLRPRDGSQARQPPMHNHGGQNGVTMLADQKTALVSLGQMGDSEGKAFSQFRTEIFAAVDNERTERVIFDVRKNGGGDNFIGDRIRRHAQLSRLNRPGGIYVLIGPQTFSAAQNFVTRMERETFAVFIGQPTGGRPNHYGDPVPFVGAHSGLTASISKLRWQDMPPMDERHWTMPDIATAELLANHMQGKDLAVAAALAHTAAPLDERKLLAPWNRDSQKAAWTPFWAT